MIDEAGARVQVTFRNNKLEKCFTSHKHGARMWGDVVGRKYIQRINIIESARELNELFRVPELKCHQLKGDRKGQFAISLTGFWRLIFTVHGNQSEIVTVEEVSKHYGD